MFAHLRAISIDTVEAISEWRVRCQRLRQTLQQNSHGDRATLHRICSTNRLTTKVMTVLRSGPVDPSRSSLFDRFDQITVPSACRGHLVLFLLGFSLTHATKHF